MRPLVVSKAVEATAGTIVDPSGELRKYGVQGTDIPSATTINLGAASGDYVRVTGTTTITSLGVAPSGVVRTIEFTGILTMIYNSANLVLPGAINRVTAPGDCAVFRSRGNGSWICISYQAASGASTVDLTPDDVGLGNVENIAISTWPGSTNINTVGTITGGVWQGTPIAANKGGTGLTACSQGDLIYGTDINTYSRLPKSTVSMRALTNQGGVNNAPTWGQIDLTTGVTGVLPPVNGGAGQLAQTIPAPTGIGVTINLALGNFCIMSLASASGNVTMTLTNPTSGLLNYLVVTQGSTTRTLAFPAGSKQPLWGGNVWSGSGALKTDIITFIFSGAVYYILGTCPDIQ
jgi:hypothetical protein